MRRALLFLVFSCCLYSYVQCADTEAVRELRRLLRTDPESDPYYNLNTEEFAFDPYDSLDARITSLLKPYQEILQIQVVLVGFDTASQNDVMSYLNKIEHKVPIHVVKGQEMSREQIDEEFDEKADFDHNDRVENKIKTEEITTGGTGNIKIERVIHYKVDKASTQLVSSFYSAIRPHLENLDDDRVIPYQAIDDIVQTDYDKFGKKGKTTSFYIFNTYEEPFKNSQYFYATLDDEDYSCASSFHISNNNGRWAWLDIRAGPVRWGPKQSGEGQVSDTVVPYIRNYDISQIKNESSTLRRRAQQQEQELFSDISAFIRKSVEILMCPAVDHFPQLLSVKRPSFETAVNLIVFHDYDDAKKPKYVESEFSSEAIERLLKQVKLFPGQKLSWHRNDISLISHPVAATVYYNSKRNFVSHKTHDNGTVSHEFQTYLDSTALHYWLGKLKGAFYSHDADIHVLPVFLFDLRSTEMLLIDGDLPVVSFPDLVVAIQTDASLTRAPFMCDNRPLYYRSNDVSRELFAATVQSLWGILPTEQRWSQSHNRIEEDYLWSAAVTPFGPFSHATELSFALTDQIYRPQLYQLINQTLSHVVNPLIHLRSYRHELHELLSESVLQEFAIRWNLYDFKMNEAVEYTSLHDWNNAYIYTRSAAKDADALLAIIKDATNSISSYLQCSHTPKSSFTLFLWTYIVPVLAFLIAAILIFYLIKLRFLKKRTITNKKKW